MHRDGAFLNTSFNKPYQQPEKYSRWVQIIAHLREAENQHGSSVFQSWSQNFRKHKKVITAPKIEEKN